jgi:hypothetical protein
MPRAGFEAAIPMFERPKTVLALDRSAIETVGIKPFNWPINLVHCNEQTLYYSKVFLFIIKSMFYKQMGVSRHTVSIVRALAINSGWR